MSEENQGLTVQELVAAYDFCQSQRNAAQNENAILAGRLAGAMNKVAELTKALEASKSEQEEESNGNDGSDQE